MCSNTPYPPFPIDFQFFRKFIFIDLRLPKKFLYEHDQQLLTSAVEYVSFDDDVAKGQSEYRSTESVSLPEYSYNAYSKGLTSDQQGKVELG